LTQISEYVQQAFSQRTSFHQATIPSVPFREIPTLNLLTGINLQDNQHLYAQIANHLTRPNDKEPRLVVQLSSTDCPQVKPAMAYMIDAIIRKGTELYGNEVDLDTLVKNQRASKKLGKFILPRYDMRYLMCWYQYLCTQLQGRPCPEIVIIFQDFEGFNRIVLEVMIQILSEYIEVLPIVFVFGIATSTDIIHQSLPKHVTSLLQTESLSLQLSVDSVNKIVERLLLSAPWGFTLGYKAYKYILDRFFLHNFSVTSLITTLHYALMDYFYSNPLAILTPFLSTSLWESLEMPWLTISWVVERCSASHYEFLRMQPSFRQFLEGLDLPPQDMLRLLDDDSHFAGEMLPVLLDRVKRYRCYYTLGIECFHNMQSHCETNTLKKPLRILHLFGLNEALPLTKHYELVTQSFKRRSLDIVKTFLDHVVQHFTAQLSLEEMNDGVANVIRAIQAMKTGLDDSPMYPLSVVQTLIRADTFLSEAAIAELVAQVQQLDDSESDKINREATPSTPRQITVKEDLMRSLLTGNNKSVTRTPGSATPQRINRRLLRLPDNKKHLTDTQLLWMDAAYDAIHQLFTRTLVCYDQLPWYEIFYYGNERLLKRAFTAQPRASLQTALGQPWLYMHCACCPPHEDGDTILPTLQDTCTLYKLYLECGRMINLYDWFMAFSSIKEKEPHQPSSKELQARFIRSVSELQYLGFLKSTSRKTDHVLRIVW
ncbi:Origin recognition complex subunit 3, partial [Dispira parvispora]